MTEIIVMVTMLVLAVLAIHASQLRVAIIYLSVFSLLTALLYLLLAAPELAIAEGAIGSGLVTLLYLACLKRNRVYTIGVVSEPAVALLSDAEHRAVESSAIACQIRDFLTRRELDIQLVFIDRNFDQALSEGKFDLLLVDGPNGITAHSTEEDYVTIELEVMFQMHGIPLSIHYVATETEVSR